MEQLDEQITTPRCFRRISPHFFVLSLWNPFFRTSTLIQLPWLSGYKLRPFNVEYGTLTGSMSFSWTALMST
ncbi:hypothetical protein BURKHO8Y_60045 [Burkholderia sp. 8Y]|nr:hypothetical protein BURKHO8Y_60045 [Burkholderia sp. 8Y]